MTRRDRWLRSETRDMLEALVEMKVDGFNPNESANWYNPTKAAVLIDKLKAKNVNSTWTDDIDKVRKKYSNIKADYQKFLKLDKYNTGKEVVDGHENGHLYGALMHELVSDTNPVSSPIIVVDNGTVSEQVPPPISTVFNPLQKPEKKSKLKDLRAEAYKGISSHFKQKGKAELTEYQKQDLEIQNGKMQLSYMQFYEGKTDEEIERLQRLAARPIRVVVPVQSRQATETLIVPLNVPVNVETIEVSESESENL